MGAAWLRHPLPPALIAYWLGLTLGRYWLQDYLPPLWLTAGLTLVAVGSAWRLRRRTGAARLIYLPFLALGLTAIGPYTAPDLKPDGLYRLVNRTSLLTVRVIESPAWRDWGVYLIVEVESGRPLYKNDWESLSEAEPRERKLAGRMRLLLADRAAGINGLALGARLRVMVTPRPVVDFANPGTGSYRTYLSDRRVFLRGSIRRPERVVRLARPGGWAVGRWLDRFRLGRLAAIRAAAPGSGGAALAALTLGRKDFLPQEVGDAFSRLGLSHLLVVSGLHLGLVGLAAMVVVRRLWGLTAGTDQSFNALAPARLAALAAVFGYALLAANSAATYRALIMVLAAGWAGLAGRRTDGASGLLAAALLISLAWPAAPFDLGFRYSIIAVAAMVLVLPRLDPLFSPRPNDRSGSKNRTTRLIALVRSVLSLALVTVVVSLAVAPLTALHFQHLPAAGLILNLILIPLFGWAVIPLGLIGLGLDLIAPGPAGYLLRAAAELAGTGLDLAARVSDWPGVQVQLAGWNIWFTLLAYLALISAGWGLVRKNKAALWGAAGAMVCLALVIYLAGRPVDRLRATMLDVGQGSAMLVRLPGGQDWLIDGGGLPGSGFDIGRYVVVPALRAAGVNHLTGVVISHPHPDHYAGLEAVIKEFVPRYLAYPGQPNTAPDLQSIFDLARNRGLVRLNPAQLARTMSGAGVTAEALWPPAGFPESGPVWLVKGPDRDNESSLVLRLTKGRTSLLVASDIQDRAQAALAESADRGQIDLTAQILQAPHHGGVGSCRRAFLNKVKPDLALVSAGFSNRFGSPRPDTLARLREAGVKALSTSRVGAIRLSADGVTWRTEPVLPRGRPCLAWMKRVEK